jgi:two-component system, LytTR family, response regulator
VIPSGKPRGGIHALIVDDEALARRNLAVLLRRDPDIASVVECESGVEAIEVMRESRHNLVFLDVQMPECGGFDVLEMLGNDLPPAIIFVTAYQEYALRAFEAGALDYLLKPFDDARFVRALDRAKEKISHYLPRESAQRLVIKGRGQVVFVKVPDIDWIESAGYYACLHVGSQTHIMRRTLSELEHDLGHEKFMRTHRSSIVNLDRVQGLELQNGGDYEILLKSGVRLQLSRRFRKQVQTRIEAMGSLEMPGRPRRS